MRENLTERELFMMRRTAERVRRNGGGGANTGSAEEEAHDRAWTHERRMDIAQ